MNKYHREKESKVAKLDEMIGAILCVMDYAQPHVVNTLYDLINKLEDEKGAL